jgi:GntR family transcriptional regulator, transcriptional repressor for pyruvate dehydrogenase complex
MRLKKVPKTSLVDAVAAQLRATIENRKLSCGDRIPSEPELVRQLGVSRPVLREAIGRLQSIGLLTVKHGRGTFVAERDALLGCVQLVRTALGISSADLVQFIELRAAIESQAARRAAERAADDQSAELERLCREIDAEGLDYEEALSRDLKFHLRIVELGGNRLMLDVMRVIQELIVEAMARTSPRPRARRYSQQLHMAIVRGIRSGDPDAAEAAVRRHMEAQCQRLHQAGSADEAKRP